MCETLVAALAAGCVPVYWGCPSIANFFDPEGSDNDNHNNHTAVLIAIIIIIAATITTTTIITI